jgi:hypothetical protein
MHGVIITAENSMSMATPLDGFKHDSIHNTGQNSHISFRGLPVTLLGHAGADHSGSPARHD